MQKRRKVDGLKADSCCISCFCYNSTYSFVFPTIQWVTYNSALWSFLDELSLYFLPLLMLLVHFGKIGEDEQRYLWLFRGQCAIQGVEWISSCSTQCGNTGADNWVLFVCFLSFFSDIILCEGIVSKHWESLAKFAYSKWLKKKDNKVMTKTVGRNYSCRNS